jgi:hypothetical protein
VRRYDDSPVLLDQSELALEPGQIFSMLLIVFVHSPVFDAFEVVRKTRSVFSDMGV